MMILIVNNQQSSAEKLERLLGKLIPKASIRIYTNPLRAIQFACNNPVEYAFSALNMRPIDGVDMVQSLRRTGNIKKCFLISDPEEIEDSFVMEDDADGILYVPVSEQDIRQLLSHVG